MKVRSSLSSMVKKNLSKSLPTDMIQRLAHEAFPGYDLQARTGFPSNSIIPGQLAANCLVDDAAASGRFLHLIEALAALDRRGFMGRSYKIIGLGEIRAAIEAEGYVQDETTGYFMEGPKTPQRTPNWGRLFEGEEHRFSLLRIDVVHNSQIVRVRGEKAARCAFDDIRSLFTRCVEMRFGRVWNWEGDGALAAFLFGHSTTSAVLAGMSFLNELFMYNRLHNSLGEALLVRGAAHTGPLRYSDDPGEIARQETVIEIMAVESQRTPPGKLSISSAVAPTLDPVLLHRFRLSEAKKTKVLCYGIGMGDS